MTELDELDATFEKWLGDTYDLDSIHLALITAAIVQLDGDLLWTLIVSGSGNAKTETVQALRDAEGVRMISTLSSSAALLSGSPKRESDENSTGGLLAQIGAKGVLVIKDVTSILSMPHTARDGVLAALREVYDGYWSRESGANGGQNLEWSGRIAVVGAVTTAWDTHHAAVATFGDRFVLLRTDSTTRATRHAAARQSVDNIGSEDRMRSELAGAAKAVLENIGEAPHLHDNETTTLRMMADLACRARGAVERDFKGEPLFPHAPEMPTRLAKQLAQIVRGGVAIGMQREDAMRLALRCALDSIPPLRLKLLRHLAKLTSSALVAEVVKAVQHPRNTVDRELQCLQLLGLAEIHYEEYSNRRGEASERWRYGLSMEAAEDYAKYLRESTFSGKVRSEKHTLSTQTHSYDFSGKSAELENESLTPEVESLLNSGPPTEESWRAPRAANHEGPGSELVAARPF
ncbi:ArsR family transcriptional regulator [Mycolicibacterium frederiksbergense]|uniref:ArsR family transcriptional regulator n=1 Tax=Mycolicibacterium frederiksbergense TaxID=117567 RepID=UPI00265BB007|nr:ArsR family transcriptional regulator [Mycolicibacterium frederiksbergense]MDO0976956.1 ArsR family transcriptional regulator [Mycolicibacterium frederiksbergense]